MGRIVFMEFQIVQTCTMHGKTIGNDSSENVKTLPKDAASTSTVDSKVGEEKSLEQYTLTATLSPFSKGQINLNFINSGPAFGVDGGSKANATPDGGTILSLWRKVLTNIVDKESDSLSVISFEDHNRYRFSVIPSFEWTFVGNPITHLIDFVDNFHNNDYLSIHSVALAVEPPNAGPNLKRVKLIRPVHNSNKMTFNVYCSAKKKWHDSNAHVEMDSKIFSWRSHSPHYVYVKGKVHWFNDKFMVWFNVREDVAGTIPLPANTGGITSASVGVSDGELSYCNITIDSKLNVWLRRGEWERLYEVSLDTIIIDNWDVIAPDTAKPMNRGTDFLRHHLVSTMSYEGGDMLMMSMVMEREKRDLHMVDQRLMHYCMVLEIFLCEGYSMGDRVTYECLLMARSEPMHAPIHCRSLHNAVSKGVRRRTAEATYTDPALRRRSPIRNHLGHDNFFLYDSPNSPTSPKQATILCTLQGKFVLKQQLSARSAGGFADVFLHHQFGGSKPKL
ncbi:hypothetical protein Syun_018124 [Stephania yunnanensis]|uniref:Uncharacterized protein n=1 Tax=Stephania yunnanensis TaxID=152371 RepID=A0AAP0IRP0_9MAGN